MSQQTYDRLERVLAGPMLVLSVVLIPVLLWPVINPRLSPVTQTVLDTVDYGIWAAFAAEYLAKLAVAPHRRRYVRTHLLDLALVALPMLRPLRVLGSVRALRVLRVTRLAVVVAEAAARSRQHLASRASLYAVGTVALLLVAASAVVLDVERDAPHATITGFSDALWWAVTTVTTVGYGDHYPVTGPGKAVAAVVMFAGIAAAGVVTASIAAWFVKVTTGADQTARDEVAHELRELGRQVAALTARLEEASR